MRNVDRSRGVCVEGLVKMGLLVDRKRRTKKDMDEGCWTFERVKIFYNKHVLYIF